MKLVYFAWVSETIGLREEDVTVPEDVLTVSDLLSWLATKGENYSLFKNPEALRVAINQEHVSHDTLLAGADEVALFPPMTGG